MDAHLSTAPHPGSPAAEPPAARPPSRRSIWPALVAGVVVLAVIVSLVVLAHVRHDHELTPPDARSIGLPVLVGRTLHEPDGRTSSIELDADIRIDRIDQTPAGILLDTEGDPNAPTGYERDALYLQTPESGAEPIATNYDSGFVVTDDGSIVVAIESDGYAHAINLTTRTDLKTRFAPGDDPEQPETTALTSVSGDRALLTDDRQPYPIRPAELWNVRTGAVTALTGAPNTAVFAVGPDQNVLLGVYASADSTYGDPGKACYDYEPAVNGATASNSTGTGFCATVDFQPSTLSPTGAWAVVIIDGQADVLATADLHAGRLHSTLITNLGSEPMFWDTPTSFIDTYPNDTDGQSRYQRCFVDGHCRDLGAADSAIVGRLLT